MYVMVLSWLYAISPLLRTPSPRLASGPDEFLLDWLITQGGGGTVSVGEHGGVRGLIASRSAEVGDVLLEVPLTAAILDRQSDADPSADHLTGCAPEWSSSLPWNVQLAVCLLEKRGQAEWEPFFSSWPAEAPALPKDCEGGELALAGDRELEDEAGEAFFWLDEQYWAACDAAEGHAAAPFTASEFNSAMAFVWSRCLRVTTSVHGVRRVLVPLLDLANHESMPSAIYTFSAGAACGAAIRLHAVRCLREGDPVTITYGEHSSAHFANYYGFVPRDNPYDAFCVTTAQVVHAAPTAFESDCEAALASLPEPKQAERHPLKAAAPPTSLIDALIDALAVRSPSETRGAAVAAAVRALVEACGTLKNQLLCGSETEVSVSRPKRLDLQRAHILFSLLRHGLFPSCFPSWFP